MRERERNNIFKDDILNAKIFRHILFIGIIATIAGLGVNFQLIHRFFKGEFEQAFFSPQEFPTITFISLAEAEELFASQQAVFIDSRPERDYEQGHIVGALNIPFDDPRREEILSQLNFPPEQTLVVYCDGSECRSSVELAKILHTNGFQSIKVFFGGWLEWIKAGLPVAGENVK